MAQPFLNQQLLKHVEGRLGGMKIERYSWWVHWRELATFILPRRYKWLITPNEMQRGSPLNGFILDSTGTIAARYCASGIMSGVSSPSRPWFKLAIAGVNRDEGGEGSLWLDIVERTIMRVLQESNFYNSIAVLYFDMVVFGTGVMLIYEDYADVIRCYNPCLGEFYLANSDRMDINAFAREFVRSVSQVEAEFGRENVSPTIAGALRQGGASMSREVALCHLIEPNRPGTGVPSQFPFYEVYWERGNAQGGRFLRRRGFWEFPVVAGRWDVVANDSYGRGPGMDALPDIQQLQQETKRKAQAIDKQVNPPMLADSSMKNQPASLIPGGVTYVNGLIASNNPGMRPIYQVAPQIEHMTKDLAEIQNRIKQIFFNDLFLMISELSTVRTATEIDARREEKLVMLGPVLERLENEVLDPSLRRVYNILRRGRLIPDPPESLKNREITIEYVSMLAQAQKAVATASIERVLGLAGNMVAVFPDIKDNINADETIRQYGEKLGVPPVIYNSPEEVAAIREQRNAAMQQQIQAAQLKDLVGGAEQLSKTDLNSNNALTALIGAA